MNEVVEARAARIRAGRVAATTLVALVSFALNSLLCRAALAGGLIDATSFTLVRLTAGALVLSLLARTGPRSSQGSASRLQVAYSALALFLYALPFSLAYVRIEAGTGAFILFAAVQVTMIGSDLLAGRRLTAREGLGLAVTVGGLAWLTRPGVESPDLGGSALMATAGFSWGIYSIRGRTSGTPLLTSARNFAATVPLAGIASVLALESAHLSATGVSLALISGGITSGLGYVAWYAAVPSLGTTRASIVQLAVPPLAAALGVVLLGEVLTSRLLFGAPLILGGIALAFLRPRNGP